MDAFVTVDDEVAVGLLDDDDRSLLAGFSQRSDQPALAGRVADPEAFQAAVQLVKFQCLPHGFQYAPAAVWSFAPKVGCCQQPYWVQWDSGLTGLSSGGRVVGT